MGGTREHDGVHGGGLRGDRTEGVRTDVPREMPLDEVIRAVLARDEVVAYLNGSHGESGPKAAASGSTPISTSCGPGSDIRSTAR